MIKCWNFKELEYATETSISNRLLKQIQNMALLDDHMCTKVFCNIKLTMTAFRFDMSFYYTEVVFDNKSYAVI